MNEIEIAKKTIIEELEKYGFRAIKIILFGSRARGDFKEDSDLDLLVIVDKDIQPALKRKISGKIYRLLSKMENSFEIVIKSYSNFERMKHFVGCICYEADKEGIPL